MSAVYSTSFHLGDLPTGAASLYTVPTANVIVVRDLELFMPAGMTGQINIYVVGPGGQAQLVFLPTAAAGTIHQWNGRVVVPGGGQIASFAVAAGAELSVSGYLLTT